MKQSHRENKTQEVEIVDDIKCNMCGESCKTYEPSTPGFDNDFGGLIEHTISGSYHSHGAGLIDTVDYTFSICELCLVKLFDQFKIEPKIESVHDEYPSNLAEHKEMVAWRLKRELPYEQNVLEIRKDVSKYLIEHPHSEMYDIQDELFHFDSTHVKQAVEELISCGSVIYKSENGKLLYDVVP